MVTRLRNIVKKDLIAKSERVNTDDYEISWDGELRVIVSISIKGDDDFSRLDEILEKVIYQIKGIKIQTRRFKAHISKVNRLVESGSDGRSYSDNLSKIIRPRGGSVK